MNDKATTRDDLEPLGLQIEEIWRQTRPQAIRLYESQGILYQRIKEAEQGAAAMHERLFKEGRDAQETTELVDAEWIHLRDLSDPPQD